MPYLAIFLFAIIRRRDSLAAQCARAITGDLNWLAVIAAGAPVGARSATSYGSTCFEDESTGSIAFPPGRLLKHRERTRSFPRDRHRARQPLLCRAAANGYPDCLRLRRNASLSSSADSIWWRARSPGLSPSLLLVRGRRQHTGCPRRAVVVGAVHSGRLSSSIFFSAGWRGPPRPRPEP